MSRLGLPHLIISGVATILFTLMAVGSFAYAPQTAWFPLYTGIAGATVSLILTIMSLFGFLRRDEGPASPAVAVESTEADPSGAVVTVPPSALTAQLVAEGESTVTDLIRTGVLEEPATTDVIRTTEQNDRNVLLGGYAWLLLWVGYVVAAMLVGFALASLALLGVWFRTAVRSRWWAVAIIVVAVGAFLWVADMYLGMAMPGGWGVLGGLVGRR